MYSNNSRKLCQGMPWRMGVFSPFSFACLSSSLRWKEFFFIQSSPKSSRYQPSMPASKSICTFARVWRCLEEYKEYNDNTTPIKTKKTLVGKLLGIRAPWLVGSEKFRGWVNSWQLWGAMTTRNLYCQAIKLLTGNHWREGKLIVEQGVCCGCHSPCS